MPNIIKDGNIVADSWVVVDDAEITSAAALPSGDLLLPLTVWQALAADLSDRNIGVWLNSEEAPLALKDSCTSLSLIAINFPAFADGRGYSYANVLRSQYGYKGELRAIGDVLKDQLGYMKRVGFNSYALRSDQNLEESLQYFADFSKPYQAANDNDKPLFAQR